MDLARSKNDVLIRLTDERWLHITEEHSELAGYYFDVLETIENPDVIYLSAAQELIGVKELTHGKFLAVVYKETSKDDGFIITAFITRRKRQLERKHKVWERPH
jgi:hypothetical protein